MWRTSIQSLTRSRALRSYKAYIRRPMGRKKLWRKSRAATSSSFPNCQGRSPQQRSSRDRRIFGPRGLGSSMESDCSPGLSGITFDLRPCAEIKNTTEILWKALRILTVDNSLEFSPSDVLGKQRQTSLGTRKAGSSAHRNINVTVGIKYCGKPHLCEGKRRLYPVPRRSRYRSVLPTVSRLLFVSSHGIR